MYMTIIPLEKVQTIPQNCSFKFRSKQDIPKQVKYVLLASEIQGTLYEMFVILKQDLPVILLSFIDDSLVCSSSRIKKCVAAKIIDRIYIVCNYYGFYIIVFCYF